MSLYLHGIGHFHPENEITNRFLEELEIGTSEGWILERVGIQCRRTVLPLDYIRETGNRDPVEGIRVAEYSHADTGRRAAEMAVARAGIDMQDIGMVITGSSRPDMMSPADACTVAEALELEVPSFDINSACTSLFTTLNLLGGMREDALPEYVLAVTPESLTTTVDYTDRSASVLWGDGTTATVLSTKVPSRIEVVRGALESSPAGKDKVIVPVGRHFEQEGRTVQMFAIKKTIRLLRRMQRTYGRAPGRRLHFIGHQANLRMLETVCGQCGIEPERHHHNVVDLGNTGAAGAPSVVSQRWDAWEDGDDIAVVGVGSGLTWSSFLLRFGEVRS
ncbi:MAG: ketoacyl-ACP synthase III [Gemmatimonadota bacterium]|jgi:3-oxoacyl-[acyl-carrier-protein] synthase-3